MNYRLGDKIKYKCPKTGCEKTMVLERIDQKNKIVYDNFTYMSSNSVPFKNIIKVIKRKRKSSAFKKQSYILIDKYGKVEGITKRL